MPDQTTKKVRPTYSVVIPAYNSDNTLVELAERTNAVFTEVLDATYELVIVDDDSSNPNTWHTCESIIEQYSGVAVRLIRNCGKAGAILCGFSHASGEWVITIDDDLQQLPEDIPALVQMRSHDVVIGSINEKHHSLFIRLTSRAKGYFDRIILDVPCAMSPLKLIRSEIIVAMLESSTARPFIPALLSDITSNFVTVPITHAPSKISRSRYTLFRRFSQFSNLVIGNSSLLLRITGAIGASAAISGFIFAIYTITRAIAGANVVPGWSSLIVINLIFGGLILIALGINGEYLLRTLETARNKPAYRVRKVISSQELD